MLVLYGTTTTMTTTFRIVLIGILATVDSVSGMATASAGTSPNSIQATNSPYPGQTPYGQNPQMGPNAYGQNPMGGYGQNNQIGSPYQQNPMGQYPNRYQNQMPGQYPGQGQYPGSNMVGPRPGMGVPGMGGPGMGGPGMGGPGMRPGMGGPMMGGGMSLNMPMGGRKPFPGNAYNMVQEMAKCRLYRSLLGEM